MSARQVERPVPASLDSRRSNEKYPGFLFRRLQQVSSAIFFNSLRPFGMTPIQHTILRVLEEHADLDQRSLATLAGLDASTTTDVLTRLAEKRLVVRTPGVSDRRTRKVRLSANGRQLLAAVKPEILAGQRKLLGPLSPARRRELIRMLMDLLDAHASEQDNLGAGRPWRRMR